MMSLLQDVNIGDFLSMLLKTYGVNGFAFGFLLILILRQNKTATKRIRELEKAQQDQYKSNLDVHKQMIDDYVDLVRNKTAVLSNLTGCLNAIKNTLERLENKTH